MHKLFFLAALLLALVAGSAHAQSARLSDLVNHADELEIYGELAERCSYALRSIGKPAIEGNHNCVMLLDKKPHFDALMEEAGLYTSIDYDTLSVADRVTYTEASEKYRAALQKVIGAFQRILFLSE